MKKVKKRVDKKKNDDIIFLLKRLTNANKLIEDIWSNIPNLDWIYEDALETVLGRKITQEEYDRIFPMSKVDGVRLFPATFNFETGFYKFFTEAGTDRVYGKPLSGVFNEKHI